MASLCWSSFGWPFFNMSKPREKVMTCVKCGAVLDYQTWRDSRMVFAYFVGLNRSVGVCQRCHEMIAKYITRKPQETLWRRKRVKSAENQLN